MDEDIDSFFIHFLKNNRLEYPERYINLFYDIVEPILMNCKNYWNRPRPNQLAKLYGTKIDVLVTDTINTASYPSGHTVYSKLVGNILTDMYPELSSQILSIAERTGKARVQQGVHYPSDNGASFVFSNYVYDKLKNRLKQYS
jgi:membrane-associated phospholipid phosphatase